MYKFVFALALLTAFASCKKETKDCPASVERTYSPTGFTRIAAGDAFSVTVKQGAAYAVTATGCTNDLDDLDLVVEQGGILSIKYRQYKSDRYKTSVEITLPVLAAANFSGASTAIVQGFGQQTSAARFVLSGTATCRVDALPVLVRADLSGSAALDLVGTATDLIATVSGDARLNAYTATFDDADLYASGTAKARVQVQKSLAAFASGDSRIYYKGTPSSVSTEESGTAKIIRE